MLQPATKALAQMLAGRAGVSGQLNHARNLLAHAERLIGDRVHNRLIPAEREEFLEQLALLRLTLADADAEAQVKAAEQQEEKRPPPPPVAQERLKELALALSRPERDRPGQPRPADEADDRDPGPGSGGMAAKTPTSASTEAVSDAPAQSGESSGSPARPALRPLDQLPGRLVLSKMPGGKAPGATASPLIRRSTRPLSRVVGRTANADGASRGTGHQTNEESSASAPLAGNGSTGEAAIAGPVKAARRRGRKTKDGLPEGWVIDEDGYVVPRQG
jgi:hypothetical protein